jgi:hypothetical protein
MNNLSHQASCPTIEGPAMASPRKTAQRVSPPCSKRLRSDLLNKLGIVDGRSRALLTLPLNTSGPLKAPEKTLLGPIKIVKAPLKKDEGPDPNPKAPPSFFVALGSFFRVGSPSSEATTATAGMESDDASSISSSSERHRNLTFDEEVSVVHIPRREQYSNRIQQHLWHSPEILHANVMRNTIEYSADGWKWQDVREEEDHVVCCESGELIHPVHEEIARMIRHEQGLPPNVPVWTPFLKEAPIGTCSASSPREGSGRR